MKHTIIALTVIASFSATAAVSDAEFNQVQTDVFRVKTSLTGVQNVVTNINTNVVGNTVKIDALQTQVDNGLVNLNSKVNEVKATADKNTQAITALGGRMSTAESSLASQDKRISAVEARHLAQDGKDGKDGATGATGANGKDGAKGDAGLAGANGSDGKDGANGADGAPGQKGDTGEKGDKGDSFVSQAVIDAIEQNNHDIKRVGAIGAAQANLHYNANRSGYAIALGEYRGVTGIAGGLQYGITESTAVTLQAAYDGKYTSASVGFHGDW